MTTPCPFLNPLRRDGTSQMQRLVRALSPAAAPIDERGPDELLAYACEYAKLLRYYTTADAPGGDWSEFIERDVSTVAALMARQDPEAWQARFDEKQAAALDLVASLTPSADERATAFLALFDPIVDLVTIFNESYERASDGLALKVGLDRAIRAVLAPALREAAALLARARLVFPTAPGPALDVDAFAEVWDLGAPIADNSLLESKTALNDGEYRTGVQRVGEVFNHLHQGLVSAVQNAPGWLDETLERHPEHQPHVALFLAFLALFRYAQDHLNTLTGKHLDFYYRQVLGLEPRPAQPDCVHIVFELAKNFERRVQRVPSGTMLLAGKDATGVNLLYATSRELVVNRAVVDPAQGLKTVFVQKAADGSVISIHAAAAADSSDGRGAKLTDADGKWLTFGGPAMPVADRLGFAIASSMFLLTEGKRTIIVTLRVGTDFFALAGEATVERDLRDSLIVQASGAKGWIDLEWADAAPCRPVAIKEPEEPGVEDVIFTFQLGADDAAIVGYDRTKLDGGFDTTLPVIRFLLREGHIEDSYAYKYLQRMPLSTVLLDVNVEGARKLILENDYGVVDPAKPFFPFGAIPRAGGSFLIGSPEIFQKPLTGVTLRITWADLPKENFYTRYSGYTTDDGKDIYGNGYFRATAAILDDGDWTIVDENRLEDGVVKQRSPSRLFEDHKDSPWAPVEARDIDLTLEKADLSADPSLGRFQRFDATLRRGFLKLTLIEDFRHAMYVRLLAMTAMGKRTGDPPKAPYTPLIAEFSLDYRASEALPVDGSSDTTGDDADRLYHILPFGYRRVLPQGGNEATAGQRAKPTLVPEFTVNVRQASGGTRTFNAEGTLYIGLANLEPPQNVTLLVQVAEGSEDPDVEAPPDVVWSYLGADEWHDFQATEIVADGTNGLLTSGVIEFAVPVACTDRNTTLPAGLRWIKASVRDQSVGIPKLIAIRTQAVTACFSDHGNDPSHLAAPLPAGTISKLQTRDAAVKSVTQPYASFGGRMRESADAFRLRTSERLRHKRRAITIFDYERLVLEQFPDVYKVKCLNHTTGASEYTAGAVRVVVVPNLRNRNAVDPLCPRFSSNRLKTIASYLRDLASNFVSIEVANPKYEQIRARFNVRFRPGRDKGLYTKQLNDDIIRFLSPWLYDDAADLTLGGRVHRSAILNYVEERDYVDFVTDFQMDQIADNQTRLDVEVAEVTTSGSALVPAPQHVIGDQIVSCEDKQAAPGSADQGIPKLPAPPPVAPAGARYLGNSRDREMHDLQRITKYCHIDQIGYDRIFYFSDLQVGLDLGYDYCAYCFGRDLSQR